MAKDITIKNPQGTVTYYPKTVSQLVFDNDNGKTVKEDIDETKSHLIKKTDLTPTSSIEAAYINSGGGISMGGSSSFVVLVYEIEQNTLYNILNKYHNSSLARNFAVYSSTEISSSNCIYVANATTLSSDNTIYSNSSSGVALAISTNTSCEGKLQESDYFDIQNIDDSLTVVENVVDDISKEIYTDVERTDYVRIPTTYISDNSGNTTTSNAYNLDYFEVSEGEKFIIHFEGNTTSPIGKTYAMYSDLPFNSSTKVGEVGRAIGSDAEITLEVTIEEGANYLAVAELNDSSYPSFTRTVTEVKSVKKLVNDLAEDVDDKIDDISDEVSDLADDFNTLYTDEEITEWEELVGQYVKNDSGEIASFGAYNLDYFEVNEGEVYDIDISVVGANAAARAYAMYSSYPFSTENKVGTVGVKVGAGFSGTVEIVEGARYLAVCAFKTASYPQYTRTIINKSSKFITETVDDIQTEIDDLKTQIIEGTSGEMCVEFDSDGESVYIAYLENPTTEITYWFKKCMANELYTFYRVGYRTVSRSYADTEGIKLEHNITPINSTASDNIGPIFLTNPTSTDTNGHWTGGNHHYPNETAENIYKTASNYSYIPFADSVQLNVGEKKYCDTVTINVVNHLFDPFIPTIENGSLTVLFSTETVAYKIKKNSIEVSLRQKIVPNNTNKINMYLGMQSMFYGENKIMTPNGDWTSWQTVTSDEVHEFTKGNYPNFNRYIESNSNNGTYQSTYLIPNKMGTHSQLDNSTYIFRKSNMGKCYHHLLYMEENIGGKSYVWSGVYTFFHTPILNNENAFVYCGIINDKDAIFINTLQSCDIEIELPNEFLMRKMNVVEQSNTITTQNSFTDVVGIQLTASGSGSFIFTLD